MTLRQPSLSLKLVGIFSLVALLFVLAVRIGVQWMYDTDYLRELVSGHLQLHVDLVREDIGTPPDIERARRIVARVPVDIRIAGPGVDWASDSAFPEIDALEWSDSDFFKSPDEGGAWFDELGGLEYAIRGNHRFLKMNEDGYVIAVSTPKVSDDIRFVSPTLVVTVIGLGLLLTCYLLVRWLFRPVETIQAGMAKIGAGDLAHRVRHDSGDELGALSRDINRLASRVRTMLDAKRELLLGMSHELRSPLTRLKLAVEMLDDQSRRELLLEDLNEMSTIIGELLEAERLNDEHAVLAVADTTPGACIADTLAEHFPGANVQVDLERADEAVRWDPVRIRLMLKNVIQNALKHGGSEHPVLLASATGPDAVRLSVTDRGPGIPADEIAKVTEPFYRTDRSRTRDTGGVGLGLYLADRICRAHGGVLVIDAGSSGTAIRMTLPRNSST